MKSYTLIFCLVDKIVVVDIEHGHDNVVNEYPATELQIKGHTVKIKVKEGYLEYDMNDVIITHR